MEAEDTNIYQISINYEGKDWLVEVPDLETALLLLNGKYFIFIFCA